MASSKHFPIAILSLILCSAIAVLVLGFRLAKEERVVTIEQDRTPLSSFTTRLLRELGTLETLYQNQLINIRDQLDSGSSNIELSSVYRNIVGVEQVTIFRKDKTLVHLDLRGTDLTTPLPRPRRRGEQSSDDGIIFDVEKFKSRVFEPEFAWINQPGHPPHFALKLGNQIILLRINPEQTAAATDTWLVGWLPDAFDQVKVSGIPTMLKSPTGRMVASTGNIDAESSPDLVLPILSTLGEWRISSWALRKTIVSYRQPILISSAALAIVLAFAGFFGYAQQQRATHLAEQRVSFVNRVSHELRTPMTNILLNVDLLSDSSAENNSSQTKRIDLIREEASRLSRLLENVLTFSGLEKPRANPKQKLRLIPCNIGELIDEILSQFAPTLARKNIVTHQDKSPPPAFAFADPDAFKQIISNLISNVEKYAADGGKLEIENSSSNDEITISIIDFGPGIPKSEARRVFRPFVRLNDSTTEGVSGTGLGLAIARDLAKSMNGKLELFSQSTTGCRFTLTLPLAADNIVSIAS